MMKIIIDSREQAPLDLSPYDCAMETGSLATGDYSLAGLEDLAAIERKSLPDLVACLQGDQRQRFERELARGRGMDMFMVVIEAAMQDVRNHNYRSQMKPHAVLQSVLAFQVRYRVPFFWAGSRQGAAYTVYWSLAKYLREAELRMKVITAHSRTSAPRSDEKQKFDPDPVVQKSNTISNLEVSP